MPVCSTNMMQLGSASSLTASGAAIGLEQVADLGWNRWRVSSEYARSLVETKMGCFKRLGERVMPRDFERQVTALQIRASILNRFTSLGTPQTVRVA